MKEFWDLRYKSNEYVYGIKPNNFFCDCLVKYNMKGKILFPGEGEGRNAVYAAKKGFDVYAFDISKEGRDKAVRLALDNNVEIKYEVGQLLETQIKKQCFDVIVLIYSHFPPKILNEYHSKFVDMLNPGGYIVLEGFSKNNLELRSANPSVGGPNNIEMLFSKDMIATSFSGLEVIKLDEELIELNEGVLHIGQGMVIRYIGRKVN